MPESSSESSLSGSGVGAGFALDVFRVVVDTAVVFGVVFTTEVVETIEVDFVIAALVDVLVICLVDVAFTDVLVLETFFVVVALPAGLDVLVACFVDEDMGFPEVEGLAVVVGLPVDMDLVEVAALVDVDFIFVDVAVLVACFVEEPGLPFVLVSLTDVKVVLTVVLFEGAGVGVLLVGVVELDFVVTALDVGFALTGDARTLESTEARARARRTAVMKRILDD